MATTIERQMEFGEFKTFLANKLKQLDSLLEDFGKLEEWTAGKTDQELADYFGVGVIDATQANQLKGAIAVATGAGAAFETAPNIVLVRQIIGPGAIQ